MRRLVCTIAASATLVLARTTTPPIAIRSGQPLASPRGGPLIPWLHGGAVGLQPLLAAKAAADDAHRRGAVGPAAQAYRDALKLAVAVAATPEDADAAEARFQCRRSLAMCYLKLGDPRAAVRECTELLGQAAALPGTAPAPGAAMLGSALVLRARALRRAGRPAEARADLDRAERAGVLPAGGADAAVAGELRATLDREAARGALACPTADLLPDADLPPPLPAAFDFALRAPAPAARTSMRAAPGAPSAAGQSGLGIGGAPSGLLGSVLGGLGGAGGAGNFTAAALELVATTLRRLQEPATAAAAAALAAQVTPELVATLLVSAGVAGGDSAARAASLCAFAHHFTEPRIRKYAGLACRGLAVAQKIRAFLAWWHKCVERASILFSSAHLSPPSPDLPRPPPPF
jgi:hypothetical protein